MSESVSEQPTIPGSGLMTIGGLLLVLTFAVSAWSFLGGDWLTGILVLLYLPAAGLLLMIGRSESRVAPSR
ncbi:MAG: hypothetical protein ABEJ60_01995 [Halodesulfurarchaeum sp.]